LFDGDEGHRVHPLAARKSGRIASIVGFRSSDESAWVAGEFIRASGGLK
jgi:hypothetical protein